MISQGEAPYSVSATARKALFIQCAPAQFRMRGDWVLLLHGGEWVHLGTRQTFMVGDAELDSILHYFQIESPVYGELLVDVDHQKGIAAGWVTELRKANAGLEGRIAWTTYGQGLVAGGAYRYFSAGADSTTTEGLVRPHRLDHVSLTNQPGFRHSPFTTIVCAS